MTPAMEHDPVWNLTNKDRQILGELIQVLYRAARFARTGNDLIAVGEAWDALEQIAAGQDVEVNVGLEIGFRRSDADVAEGLFVCFRVDEDAIVLDELNTSYTREDGSDHFTRDYATLTQSGRFDEQAVGEWIAKLSEVSGFDDARLVTSRDHL